MKKPITDPFTFSQLEWATLLLAVSAAMELRTRQAHFPSVGCKRILRQLSRKLWSRVHDA